MSETSNLVKIKLDTALMLILTGYEDDIKNTIHHFVKKHSMPEHLKEDLFQETVLLLMKNLPNYNYKMSGMRTFIVNATKIACLRYRTYYFDMRTTNNEFIEDFIEDTYVDYEYVLEGYGLTDLETNVILDRAYGKTLTEISIERDISVRKIYEILDKYKEMYEKYG